MAAYYNEIDPYAAQWLRNLITAGHIAPGEVDERDIRDVSPTDLVRFDQCHFFAGIGGWSRALRLAGIPDDAPVWTGSCPCQPFSAAGSGGGFADERHLWPSWFHLIDVVRPAKVYGEQVASPDALQWFDLVCADLETAGYAVGGADLCAAGLGAPHIRQRLWFVADAQFGARIERYDAHAIGRWAGDAEQIGMGGQPGRLANAASELSGTRRERSTGDELGAVERSSRLCSAGVMGHAFQSRLEGLARHGDGTPGREIAARSIAEAGDARGMADAERGPVEPDRLDVRGEAGGTQGEAWERERVRPDPGSGGDIGGPGALYGFWRAADWLFCRDGKWRPVEPGAFPLAHGIPGRVGRLRAYGNAISPEVGAAFVRATL